MCVCVHARARPRLQIAEIEITRPISRSLCRYGEAGELARSLVPHIDANIPSDNSVAYLDVGVTSDSQKLSAMTYRCGN